MADSETWCDALYFRQGRRKFGGVRPRPKLGRAGDHWCAAEDEMESGETEED